LAAAGRADLLLLAGTLRNTQQVQLLSLAETPECSAACCLLVALPVAFVSSSPVDHVPAGRAPGSRARPRAKRPLSFSLSAEWAHSCKSGLHGVGLISRAQQPHTHLCTPPPSSTSEPAAVRLHRGTLALLIHCLRLSPRRRRLSHGLQPLMSILVPRTPARLRRRCTAANLATLSTADRLRSPFIISANYRRLLGLLAWFLPLSRLYDVTMVGLKKYLR
jgi:hypothetical protein